MGRCVGGFAVVICGPSVVSRVKIGSAQVNLLTSLRINRNPDSPKSCRTGIGHLDHLKALGALEAELGSAFPRDQFSK
jgi:hypothetical protein